MSVSSKKSKTTRPSKASHSNLVIQTDHVAWRKIPKLYDRLDLVMKQVLKFLPKKFQFPTEVTLLLTDDKNIRQLNRDFRGQNKPTNVLSFPQYEASQLTKKGKLKRPVFVGDIALSYQYVVGEAKEHNKILINHVIHLLIHGLLHLFGYDHGLEAEALRMERLEKRIMAKLGLSDPYKVAKEGKVMSRSAKRNQMKK